MIEFEDTDIWIIWAAVQEFHSYQKEIGIHPDRIEETKQLLDKIYTMLATYQRKYRNSIDS